MRAPRTARRVIGTRVEVRVHEGDAPVAQLQRPVLEEGADGLAHEQRVAAASARGGCAPRRRRPRPARRASPGWAVSRARRARARSMRTTSGRSTHPGTSPPTACPPASTSGAPLRGAPPATRRSGTLDGSSQCRSSMTIHPRPVHREQPLQVAIGEDHEGRRDLRWVARACPRPPPPTGERRRPGRRWRHRSGARSPDPDRR